MTKKKQADQPDSNYLVAGLGASAGGLDALKRFFSSLPDSTGMAFIVIVHLSPEHESNLAELLQMQTSLEVLQINEDVAIKPDHVYVIPPKKLLKIENNHLELSQPEREHGLATIDLFFRSLAAAKGELAASIVLSGTGTDGTIGMRAVKEKGGITMVQEPDDAEYAGMPRSAIESGKADLVMPVEEMADELMEYAKSLSEINISEDAEQNQKVLQKIFARVRSETGHDFSNYKRSSVLRRVERRMKVNRVANLEKYHALLKKHPDEIRELFSDLLISVTNFFRDKEAFEALEKTIIPKLFEDKSRDDELRVWVPGCATGEEAYSIAMLLYERALQVDDSPEIKVFASDIDDVALDIARRGRYPQSIVADVSSERLHRHFTKDGPEYEIKRELREMILFAPHDLLRDPPFSKQDMIACRNLLIYLNRDLQTEVFNLFHYTLRPEGYIFLGLSDSNLEATELFTAIDKKMRLYRRRQTTQSNLRLPNYPLRLAKNRYSAARKRGHKSREVSNFQELHRNLLARLYAPQSAIINENFEVVHATDDIQKFLKYGGGEPSYDILEMVRPEMRQALRSLLFQLEKEGARPLHKKTNLTGEQNSERIEIIVHSVNETDFSEGLIQVVFKELPASPKTTGEIKKVDTEHASNEVNEIIDTLEEELEYTKEQLQITVEEYETSNEELRASNEELQSMNEELQSTTEELETSQEELQSVNEELKTVNKELENKLERLNRANNDLKNLMEATEVGIVFVDPDLCVQRFTSSSTKIFNLIPSDTGRPLTHVTHNLEYEHLLDDIREVHESLNKVKKVVRSKDNRWYIMRLRPYRSIDDKIEGVVLTFVEFTELRVARETIQTQQYQETLATLGIYALEQDDLEAIMQRAIDLSCIVLQLDCSVIFALNKKQGTLDKMASAGCAKDRDAIAADKKWDIGYALDRKEPTIVLNYDEDSRFKISPFLEDEQIESSVNIVVRGSENTYGLLGFYAREEREFTDHQLNFVKIVANIVGMAMERYQTKEDLKKEVERSEQFQREILNNSVAERWELGSFLHDNLAQLMVSLKMMTGDIKKRMQGNAVNLSGELSQMNGMIDDGIAGIRDLTMDIIPVDIEEEGVEQALRFLVRHTRKLHQVNCRLQSSSVLNKVKDRQGATNLYHIIQEAVKNAAIHGEAKNIVITISESDDKLLLIIEDDGVGLSASDNDSKGKGLRIMRHRTELLDGDFTIEEISDSGQTGTRVRCLMPLQQLQGQPQ